MYVAAHTEGQPRRSFDVNCAVLASVANVVIGARNEQQLLQNLGALGWQLAPVEVARLDAVSHETPIYPYWHQKGFDERNPKPTTW